MNILRSVSSQNAAWMPGRKYHDNVCNKCGSGIESGWLFIFSQALIWMYHVKKLWIHIFFYAINASYANDFEDFKSGLEALIMKTDLFPS